MIGTLFVEKSFLNIWNLFYPQVFLLHWCQQSFFISIFNDEKFVTAVFSIRGRIPLHTQLSKPSFLPHYITFIHSQTLTLKFSITSDVKPKLPTHGLRRYKILYSFLSKIYKLIMKALLYTISKKAKLIEIPAKNLGLYLDLPKYDINKFVSIYFTRHWCTCSRTNTFLILF